jgi:hypothetical protein
MDFNLDAPGSAPQDTQPGAAGHPGKARDQPAGIEPINVKSMFEVINVPTAIGSTPKPCGAPWTRQFYPRRTDGPTGEAIEDLIEWTWAHWADLVLKPERGYSGKGVRVGEVNPDGDDAVRLALEEGHYIVQERVPLNLWAEDIPALDQERQRVVLERCQTDFRCLMGPDGLFGFLGRYGGVPTNVGSGGGVQPLAVLRSDVSVGEAVARINEALLGMDRGDLFEVLEMQRKMAGPTFHLLAGPHQDRLAPAGCREPVGRSAGLL